MPRSRGFVSLHRPSRAIADNLVVSKRDWIYVGLMMFITVGFAVDALVWTAGPTAMQWNSVIQAFGIMLFVYWWESADADQFGKRRTSLVRLLTFSFHRSGTRSTCTKAGPGNQRQRCSCSFGPEFSDSCWSVF